MNVGFSQKLPLAGKRWARKVRSEGRVPTHSIYTRSQVARAVNLAAVMGWAAVSVPVAFTTLNPPLWFASVVIGLPIAFALCWLIGAPVLKRIMRKEVSWTAAALWGIIISTLIFSVQVLFNYSISGAPTPFGWRVMIADLAVFLLKGMMIGVVVRWAIGPGLPNA